MAVCFSKSRHKNIFWPHVNFSKSLHVSSGVYATPSPCCISSSRELVTEQECHCPRFIHSTVLYCKYHVLHSKGSLLLSGQNQNVAVGIHALREQAGALGAAIHFIKTTVPREGKLILCSAHTTSSIKQGLQFRAVPEPARASMQGSILTFSGIVQVCDHDGNIYTRGAGSLSSSGLSSLLLPPGKLAVTHLPAHHCPNGLSCLERWNGGPLGSRLLSLFLTARYPALNRVQFLQHRASHLGFLQTCGFIVT